MQYMGGKQRIAKHLCKFLNNQMQPGDTFVDLFCGSCNVVSNIRQDVSRVANDLNKYLPALFSSLQSDFTLPKNVTEDMYQTVKTMPEETQTQLALKAFVGFWCSFAGKWWGGYARCGSGRNYAESAYNSTVKKAAKMTDVVFLNKSYCDVDIADGSVVYCDIPYKNTTSYSAVGEFDHEAFYIWLKEISKRCKVFVSEYEHNVPDFCEVVWRHESKKDMRDVEGVQQKTVEVLFCVKAQKILDNSENV